MSLPTHLVDANLAAYARNDIDGLGATLTADCILGPLHGPPLATGRAPCQQLYEKTIEVYPMSGTRSLNRIVVGQVVIDHEVSQRVDGARRYVATFYTIRDSGIARIETVISSQPASGLNVTQGQLDAYNAQDLDGHMAFYQPDAAIHEWGAPPTHAGADAIRARYAGLFADHPTNRAQLVNRIAVGDVVVDHERVRRAPDSAPFEVAAIYSLRSGLIGRIDFIR